VERAYRLLFSETPLQNGAAPAGLRMRLQLSLPVFLAPASRGGPPKPRVEYVNSGKQRSVRIDNTGAAHLVLTDGAFGAEKLSLPRYLLAGASVERPAPATGALALSYLNPDAQEILRSEYAPPEPIAGGR
jgi:P pilus assembly chaperone PapD